MKETAADDGFQIYLGESRAWDEDRRTSLRQSARTAWRVAIAAGAGMLLCALALLVMLPLKHTEPYVIRVDSSTGVVDSVPLYTGHLAAEPSISRYFLTHYVLTCQRYNAAMAESDYEECGAFHTARMNQVWAELWSRSNPRSPLNLHRDGSEVTVQIESISFLQRVSGAKDLAQVRYVTILRANTEGAQQANRWIATIQYAYTSPSQDPTVRRWNPLGFKILNFVVEPEVVRDSSNETRSAPQPGVQSGDAPVPQGVP